MRANEASDAPPQEVSYQFLNLLRLSDFHPEWPCEQRLVWKFPHGDVLLAQRALGSVEQLGHT